MNRRYFLAGALAASGFAANISNALVHLGNIVARTGRTIRFDPDSETVLNDSEASRYIKREYRQHWSTPKGM